MLYEVNLVQALTSHVVSELPRALLDVTQTTTTPKKSQKKGPWETPPLIK